MQVIFWICVFFGLVIFLIYFLYYFSKSLFAKERVLSEDKMPTQFSIVMSCYNEGKVINRRIEELLKLDPEKYDFEIIVTSDGSTDETNDILTKWSEHPLITVTLQEERKGKPSAINIGTKKAKYDIIVYSDIRQKYDVSVIENIIKNFADEEIGGVSCLLINGEGGGIRSIINKVKLLESKSSSSLGVYGPLYAIRKNLVKEIPGDIILDDLYISIFAMQDNKKLIADENVLVFEYDIVTHYQVMRVRRIIIGLFQMLFTHGKLIGTLPLQYYFQLLVKKYIIVFLPVIYFILFISNLFLLDMLFYKLTLILQVAVVVGGITVMSIKKDRFLSSFIILLINYISALFTAPFDKKGVKWTRLK